MKLYNYDSKKLIMEKLRQVEIKPNPKGHTKTQYRILCNLVIQKKISKRFFDLIVKELYGVTDWKCLTYEQTYELIHLLTFLDYSKVRM